MRIDWNRTLLQYCTFLQVRCRQEEVTHYYITKIKNILVNTYISKNKTPNELAYASPIFLYLSSEKPQSEGIEHSKNLLHDQIPGYTTKGASSHNLGDIRLDSGWLYRSSTSDIRVNPGAAFSPNYIPSKKPSICFFNTCLTWYLSRGSFYPVNIGILETLINE